MHELIELLRDAADQGITLWTTERKLHFRSKVAPLTPALRARLADHRDALLEALSDPTFVRLGAPDEAPFLLYYHDLWRKIRAGTIDTSFLNGPHCAWEVVGGFDAERFAQSVNVIARRHRILTATVDDRSGAPCFRYGASVAVELVDPGPGTLTPKAEKDLVEGIVWRPFALDGPLFRPFVARASAQRHFVGFVVNHLIADGISASIVERELLHHYGASGSGKRAELPEPELQYSDYLLGMNAWLRSSALEYRQRYWRRQLEGVRPCGLPMKRNAPPDDPCPVEDHGFTLGHQRTDELYAAARRMQTTPYCLLFAAHVRALCEFRGESSVAMRTLHHGRDFHGTVNIVGAFFNQLILRVRCSPADSFESTLRACQDVQAEAIANQLPGQYVCECVPGMGTDEWFPEFNCHVAGAIDPVRETAAPSRPSSDAAPDFRHFPVAWKLTPSTPRIFPGYKLNLRLEGTEIRGSVNYLGSEHDAGEVIAFVNVLTRRINEACQA